MLRGISAAGGVLILFKIITGAHHQPFSVISHIGRMRQRKRVSRDDTGRGGDTLRLLLFGLRDC